MTRTLLIAVILICIFLPARAQDRPVRISAVDQQLNTLLIQLRDQYGFQLSYNDSEISKYRVTVSGTFHSGEEALKNLLKGLPFQVKKSGEVLIIISDQRIKKEEVPKEHTQISGQIVEAGSFEPLPFSHILINNHPLVSDVSGNFNFSSSDDADFHLKISHLGYFIFDTVLYSGINKQFRLKPSTENLPEVEIRENLVDRALQVGDEPGKMKVNHNIARFLPGQGDNSVFNLLRLVPGIQAAGEQSADLLIWGSYEGQSLITLDGFTLFGLKNYNDNISVVNPFWVKNIEIYKGGFDARFGNRIGGLVNITGKNGNRSKPVFSFNINPTTLNGMVEVPLFRRSSLMAAYRQTYYNLYNLDDFNIFAPTRSPDPTQQGSEFRSDVTPDISVSPDNYLFRDLNLKYTLHFENNDQFFISFYQGSDHFALLADAVLNRPAKPGGSVNPASLRFSVLNDEINRQQGSSLFYNKIWGNGNSTKLVAAQSVFSRENTDFTKSADQQSGNIYNRDTARVVNEAGELSFRIENIFNLNNGHQVEMGGGLYANHASTEKRQVYKDSTPANALSDYRSSREFLYFQDNLPVSRKIFLKSGFRVSLVNQTDKLCFEPRVSAGFRLNKTWKMSASWGVYNQFIFKTASVDRDNNYSYLWVTGNESLPVLHASHWVTGLNYAAKGLSINFDSYYKNTRNLSREIFNLIPGQPPAGGGFSLAKGNARTFGLDLYVKKDFGSHSVWASYTLSRSEERLSYPGAPLPDWGPAPHDQRHELKLAALFNIGNFHLSADYVYGSGMQILKKVFEDKTGHISYKRVDAAVTYKFPFKKINAETGLSVLNLLDTRNLKSSNLKNVFVTQELGSVKIYTDAVPFTPTLFLKIVF